MIKRYSQPAFTLAELLIALAILGVIATFTIPKILDSGSNSKHNAIVKEAAAMVVGAYQVYKLENSASGNTGYGDLTPYMNYVRIDSTSLVDFYEAGSANVACSGITGNRCLKLHSGAIIWTNTSTTTVSFGDTSATSAIRFMVDPDGKSEGTLSGPSKSTAFYLYFNGRVRTFGTIEPNTCVLYSPGGSSCNAIPRPERDPAYFSWSN